VTQDQHIMSTSWAISSRVFERCHCRIIMYTRGMVDSFWAKDTRRVKRAIDRRKASTSPVPEQ
jgi:hypothetical protein